MNKTTVEEILLVLNDYPNLTRYGFRKTNQNHLPGLTRADFREEVDRARHWLTTQRTAKTPWVDSYGTKHMAEQWIQKYCWTGSYYISEGAMIFACHLENYKIRRIRGSRCARLGISKSTFYQLIPPDDHFGDVKPSPKHPQYPCLE